MVEPLKGIWVVDLTTRGYAGDAASKILVEFGADVVLVEATGSGQTRQAHEFDFYHGGKKSLSVDLERAEGLEVLYALLNKADVFITDWTNGRLEERGLSYDTLSADNPRIIFAHMSVWGEEGPLKDKPADPDAVWWMTSGAAWATTEAGDLPPVPIRGMANVNLGKSLDLGICAALRHRIHTGRGMYLSASVLGEAIFDNADAPVEVQYGAEYPKTRKRPRRATLNTYHCKDGWIIIITLSFEKDFYNLMEAIGRGDLRQTQKWKCMEDTLYEKSHEIVEIMDEALAKFSCDEALARIKAYDIACARIATIDDVLTDAQIAENKFLLTVAGPDGKKLAMPQSSIRVGDYKPATCKSAPAIGQHTAELLQEMGYSQKHIEKLLETKAVDAGWNTPLCGHSMVGTIKDGNKA